MPDPRYSKACTGLVRVFFVGAGLHLAGCLVVPVPHAEIVSEGFTVPENSGLPQPLKGTRADVALLLGAPQCRLDGDEVWIYHWTTSRTGIAVGVPYVAAGYGEIPHREHFVSFRFDPQGILLRIDRLFGESRFLDSEINWRMAAEAWLHPERYPGKDEKTRPELKPETPAIPAERKSRAP